ncbi:MAG: penicillin-binding protein [Candidatus Omnitrophica bacterium]|nr:penicillin-binding protein [Candidatus Omnitrophota bacterium]
MHNQRYVIRFGVIFLGLISLFIYFAIRLILLYAFSSSYLTEMADRQQRHMVDLEPIRGTVYDRNLRPLAFNTTVYSVFANTRQMKEADKVRARAELPGLMGESTEYIDDHLAKSRYFIWLKRKMDWDVTEKIKALKIHGIGFRKESKRFYPNAYLASHILGFASVDNQGMEGVELQFNNELKGTAGWMNVLRDARLRELQIDDEYLVPKNGNSIELTIDETIQYIAEKALEEGYRKNNAKGGSAIVMNVRTGEILALANRPTYDLSAYAQSDVASRTDRAISFTYEPGSVFKIVTASAALSEGVFTETDKINCENGQYKVGNHILHDHHPSGIITFQQVIEVSSNIGVTKIAQKVGPDKVYEYIQKFRFGRATGIDLKGEVRGMVKPPRLWSKTSIGAIPIGQEVTVTPLQLVSAIASIGNDGVYMKPFVVKAIRDADNKVIKSFEPQAEERVIGVDIARRMTEILVGVVERGTATKAKIKGIRVAGKTGTAQKVENGQYTHSKFYATFMGFAPADNPLLACIVVYDEPHPSYYGGTVSAPVFQRIVEDSLRYLQAKGEWQGKVIATSPDETKNEPKFKD